MEFLKLEKIEFGGIKGKMLSEQTQQIFEEFNDLYKIFSESSYDCMDLNNEVSRACVFYSFLMFHQLNKSFCARQIVIIMLDL